MSFQRNSKVSNHVCIVYKGRKPVRKAIQAEEFNHNNNFLSMFKRFWFSRHLLEEL